MVPSLPVRISQYTGTTFGGLHVGKVTYMYITQDRNMWNILMSGSWPFPVQQKGHPAANGTYIMATVLQQLTLHTELSSSSFLISGLEGEDQLQT
jgi:hypothetical protein